MYGTSFFVETVRDLVLFAKKWERSQFAVDFSVGCHTCQTFYGLSGVIYGVSKTVEEGVPKQATASVSAWACRPHRCS